MSAERDVLGVALDGNRLVCADGRVIILRALEGARVTVRRGYEAVANLGLSASMFGVLGALMSAPCDHDGSKGMLSSAMLWIAGGLIVGFGHIAVSPRIFSVVIRQGGTDTVVAVTKNRAAADRLLRDILATLSTPTIG